MANTSSWREAAGEIIHQVLKETEGQDDYTIRRALYKAYPFWERRYHPYKIWLDEIKRQRKRKTVKPLPMQIDMFSTNQKP